MIAEFFDWVLAPNDRADDLQLYRKECYKAAGKQMRQVREEGRK